METKHITTPARFKDGGEEGTIEAVFSTFGVVDRGQDVVTAKAFTDGQAVPMVWAHQWDKPVGRGEIRVEKDRAVFEGRFFMDTAAGLEAYRTVKGMGDLQEYSWGFKVTEHEYGDKDGQRVRYINGAEVFEVSPVLVGEGLNTGTVAIKSADDAKQLSVSGTMPDSYEDIRARLSLAVHEEGVVHPDEWLDVVATFDDRVIVCAYSWGMDAGMRYLEIPYTLDAEGPTLGEPKPLEAALVPASADTYADQAAKALAAARSLMVRSKSLADLRRKEGRALSAANRDRLAKHPEALRSVADEIEKLLEETTPPEKGEPPPDFWALFLETQRIETGLSAGLAI